MNKVILMGRLTRDLEVSRTAGGINFVRFTIAVNRRFKNENGEYQADFINCVAWRQTAEFIARYFVKGAMISVAGSIQTGSYQKDGQTVYTTNVNVEEAYFTGEKQRNEVSSNHSAAPAPLGDINEFTDINGAKEDLPF